MDDETRLPPVGAGLGQMRDENFAVAGELQLAIAAGTAVDRVARLEQDDTRGGVAEQVGGDVVGRAVVAGPGVGAATGAAGAGAPTTADMPMVAKMRSRRAR